MKNKQDSRPFNLIIVLVAVLTLLVLILGLIDISSFDSFAVETFFDIEDWDLDFYKIVTILFSLAVPIAIALFQETTKKNSITQYKIQHIFKFIASLNKLHRSSMIFFSPLQKIPEKREERPIFYREKYNQLAKEYRDVEDYFMNGQLLIDSKNQLNKFLNEYMELLKRVMISWEIYHIEHMDEKDGEIWKLFYKDKKAYTDKAEDLLSQIIKECKQILSKLE